MLHWLIIITNCTASTESSKLAVTLKHINNGMRSIHGAVIDLSIIGTYAEQYYTVISHIGTQYSQNEKHPHENETR